MKITFSKFHGTGNDFVIIDDRKGRIEKRLTKKIVKSICDRRFGVGADGLILLKSHRRLDFKMRYYNADGNESTMCGNGGRCLALFAFNHKLFKGSCRFEAIDGEHEAKIVNGLVHLKMNDVLEVKRKGKDAILNTGSPHYVRFVQSVEKTDVFSLGRKIRNSKVFLKEGINVNFVEVNNGLITVGTYERGVEDETYSCGTGVVASAIGAYYSKKVNSKKIKVKTKGGRLEVRFVPNKNTYQDIWLIGPAQRVYEGIIEI